MKKAIKILALLLLSTIAQAQTTEPIFNTKSSWIEVRTNLMDSTIFEITTYKVDGDTMIGDKSYSKVFRNDKFNCVLRESKDHKIYNYIPNLGREILIYDFEWYPGKTLYFQMEDELDTTFHIQAVIGDAIDSIQLLDGNYYQYLKLSEDCGLIRGIGSTHGFFIGSTYVPSDGSQFSLLCFYIDDALVYSNPNSNYCNTNSINDVTADLKIKLYPNPSNCIITVEFPENLDVVTFKIFDTKGSLIKIYDVRNKNKIEVQNLAKGFYVYSAIIKNNQKLSGKIIIQ